jgi:glutamate racemase
MDERSIGVMDSGVGGLTVVRSILDQLPHEPVIYIGDTKNSPYGPRPIAEVRELSLRVLDSLVERDVKMLVIACNSASAAMLRDARERYSIPVIEVIQPAVRRAVQATRTGKVGVIGTSATIASGAYSDAFAAAAHISVESHACPRFVEFVEAGITNSPELTEVAREYLAPILQSEVDTLVLGCTHYPLLTGVISMIVGDQVTLVSSAEETAKDVYRTLVEKNLLRDSELPEPKHEFLATGEPFTQLARRFLGPEVIEVTSL